jgi:peptidoglycan/xylan/chitin deacetylase (PgdA/CDA1 family)
MKSDFSSREQIPLKSKKEDRQLILGSAIALGSFLLGIMLPWSIDSSKNQPNLANSQSAIKKPEKVSQVVNQQVVNQKELIPLSIKLQPAVASQINSANNTIKNIENQRFTFTVPKEYQGQVVRKVDLDDTNKYVALTFDDGPWKNTTDQILAILKKNNIRATFFLIGQHLKNNPEVGKRVAAAGHVIGNHTWNHYTHNMGLTVAEKEINRTADLIYELTGLKTTLFRPPGGVLTNGLVDIANEKQNVTVMWSTDSSDWLHKSAAKITDNVVNRLVNGGIILLHDGGGKRDHVVKALPDIISNLQKQGYKFVTVPELLEIQLKQSQQQAAKAKMENTESVEKLASPDSPDI